MSSNTSAFSPFANYHDFYSSNLYCAMSEADRPLLTGDQLDGLGMAMITLAKELWIVRDRQIVTEALLKENGLLDALDYYQPNAEVSERLALERKRFTEDIAKLLLESPNSQSSSTL